MKLPVLLTLLMVSIPWAHGGDSAVAGGSLDAHVHGTSDLTIAIDGKDIEIAFESPAMNLLGFEHQASSPGDKAVLRSAVSTLKKHREIFTFSGSSCALRDVLVDASGVMANGADVDEEGNADKAESSEHHHDEDHHDEHASHEHKDSHEHAGAGRHSEITASYHFHCEQPGGVSSIEINLFKPFPGIHAIKARWLSETGQGAVTLTAERKTVKFR